MQGGCVRCNPALLAATASTAPRARAVISIHQMASEMRRTTRCIDAGLPRFGWTASQRALALRAGSTSRDLAKAWRQNMSLTQGMPVGRSQCGGFPQAQGPNIETCSTTTTGARRRHSALGHTSPAAFGARHIETTQRQLPRAEHGIPTVGACVAGATPPVDIPALRENDTAWELSPKPSVEQGQVHSPLQHRIRSIHDTGGFPCVAPAALHGQPWWIRERDGVAWRPDGGDLCSGFHGRAAIWNAASFSAPAPG